MALYRKSLPNFDFRKVTEKYICIALNTFFISYMYFFFNAGDLDSIPWLGRSPGEGKDYPLHSSGLERAVDCIVHGVAKSRTQLSDFCLSTICNQLCLLTGEGNDPLTPLQHSCLENSMVGGAWWAAVHGVA